MVVVVVVVLVVVVQLARSGSSAPSLEFMHAGRWGRFGAGPAPVPAKKPFSTSFRACRSFCSCLDCTVFSVTFCPSLNSSEYPLNV